MDYITKKIPRHLAKKISMLQAHLQLSKERNVTEGEVFSLAISALESQMAKRKRYSIMDLAGISKGKKKSSASEIDRIVYGV
ncbi:hypothetical protein J4441_00380 [Candidatus Micrarchaeota archaeon]|nr:hypothetical protein [Candidatus Micrarchaeota archaeon]